MSREQGKTQSGPKRKRSDGDRIVRKKESKKTKDRKTHKEPEVSMEELRKSEELWRITFQSIGDGVVATDEKGRVIHMNPVAETITGWSLSEALGEPLAHVFRIENAVTGKPVDDPVARVLETGFVVGLANHTKLISRDGREYQIMDSAAPIRDEAGKIRGVVLVFSDVTEKYEAREALRLSEERWKFAIEGSGFGVWDRHLDTGETYFSPRWKQIIGYEDHEISNNMDEWLRRIHPEDRAGCQKALEDHFLGRTPLYLHEYRLRCKDGSYRWILARGKVIDRDREGVPRRFVGTHTDITERKEAEFKKEEALREAWEHARRQRRNMEMLSELMGDLGLHEDDSMGGLINLTETAAAVLESDRAGVWFYSGDYSELVCRDLYDYRRNWHSTGEVMRLGLFSEQEEGHFMGRVMAVFDVDTDPRTAKIEGDYFRSAGVLSVLHVPVSLRGRLAAVLSFEQVTSRREWLPEEELTAQALGACLSNYLEAVERRKAEDKYRSIFENALEGIFQSTPEGRFLSVNPAFAHMAGYGSPEEMISAVSDIGRELYLNAEDRLRYRKILEERGYVTGFEAPMVKKDGGIFWASFNTRVVRSDQGDALYFEGTVEDITARKVAEEERNKAIEALRASEENFRRSLDESPLGIRIVSDEGETLHANRAALHIFGYDDIDEWNRTPGRARYTEESYRKHLERKKARQSGSDGQEEYEIDIVTKKGEIRHLRTWRKRVMWNGSRHHQVIYGDITAQKKAEHELTRYREFIENIEDSCFELDLSGNVTFCNEPFLKLTGYTFEEHERLSLKERHPTAEEARRVFGIYLDVYRTGKPARAVEYQVVRKDGSTADIEVSISLIHDNSGEPIGFRGIGRDITDRKRIERERERITGALRESEERYRLVVENVYDVIWTYDLSSMNYVYVSPSVERVYGFSVEEIMRRPLEELYPPDSLRKLWKAFGDLRYGRLPGDRLTMEVEHYVAGGGTLWIEISASAVKDGEGRVIGFSGISRDITDRRRVEEERERALEFLRESEERYRLVVENAQDIIWTFDLDSESFTYISPSAERVIGFPLEELLNKKPFEVYPRESRRRMRAAFQDLREGKLPGDRLYLEIEHYVAGGGTIWMETAASAIKDENGRIVGYSGVSRDITGRKRAEEERERALEALRVSEEKYRDIFRNSPDSITLSGFRDALYYEVNEEFLRITGYSREEVIGKSDLELNTWYDFEARKRYVEIMKEQGHVRNLEANFRMKDGRVTTGLVSSSLITIDGVPYLHAIIRDITEMREMEEQRLELERRLMRAQKLESVGTLAGGIAHDFNNILMGIQGNASLMLLDLDPSHPHCRRLKNIEEQVASAADLTSKLLGFARGGRYEVKPTSMNDIVQKTSQMFGRTKREVEIYKNLEPDLWSVEVDRTQMEQLLMHLYINAWQAMPGGGEIYLETENIFLDDSKVRPYEIEPGPYVKISVTDTGMGMDERTMERIFDPFFSTKSMRRGTGLGLATVYGIVRGHRGIINVYSEPGEGTTFTIYLPASEKAAVPEIMEEEKETVIKGSGTILLVDDEPSVLEVSRELVESLGYKVFVAGSGQEAVALYAEHRNEIDLVILDMIMPGISGSGTYNELKAINENVKVILSSGYSINGEAKKIMDKGCDAFIQKPFHLQELSRKIRDLLD